MKLTKPTLERMPGSRFTTNSFVLFRITQESDFSMDGGDNAPRLLINRANSFNATRSIWTFGVPKLRNDRVSIKYHSNKTPRSETVLASDIKTVGRAFAVISGGNLIMIEG